MDFFNRLVNALTGIGSYPVFKGHSATVADGIFVVIGFFVVNYLVGLARQRIVDPMIDKKQSYSGFVSALVGVAHGVLLLTLFALILDLSAFDNIVMIAFAEIHKIFSAPVLSFGKTVVTSWSLLYILLMTALLFITAAKFQAWLQSSALVRMNDEQPQRSLFSYIGRNVILCVGFIAILQSAGIDLTSLTIFASALGLGLSLGLQNIAANFLCGVVILVERPIKVGDRIEIDGIQGVVTMIEMRATTMRTNDNIEIIVPNLDLVKGKVTNLSHTSREIRLNIPVGVSYAADPHMVQKISIEEALRHPGVLKDPAPDFVLTGFGDSTVNFLLRVWTIEYINLPQVLQSELYFKLWDRYKKEGVELPFPQRDVHLKMEHATFGKIPDALPAIES